MKQPFAENGVAVEAAAGLNRLLNCMCNYSRLLNNLLNQLLLWAQQWFQCEQQLLVMWLKIRGI